MQLLVGRSSERIDGYQSHFMDAAAGDFNANDKGWVFDETGLGWVDQEALLPPTSIRTAVDVSVTAANEAQPQSLTPGGLPNRQQVERTSRSIDVSHASPLAPLRVRDRTALDEFFAEDDLPDIVLDVYRYLSRMYPEPCWEDEPYEFLHGYI